MMRDKILFTPGPLTTSFTVKEAMLRDVGSRDSEFIEIIKEIRHGLLEIAGVSKESGYEAIIMQGPGTMGIESVISSAIPPDGKLLVIINGAYGKRIREIAEIHHIQVDALIYKENQIPPVSSIEECLSENKDITHLAIVHCETTSGIINPVEETGKLCRNHGITYIVDAMSSFGAIPLNVKDANIHFLISSANKCIEGVPGFSFIIANTDELKKAHYARSLTLNLYAQWEALERNGQFRFTPPTHALLAFHQALNELEEEGGPKGRAERYLNNNQKLIEGMGKMGFEPYVPPDYRGYIITSFYYPDNSEFSFEEFYEFLSQRGLIIYPGKLGEENTFRIGNIGRIGEDEINRLLHAVDEYMHYIRLK